MGESHRKLHEKPAGAPEMVTKVITMSKAAWAVLDMMVDLSTVHDGPGAEAKRAVREAKPLTGEGGRMIADVAAMASGYDVDAMTAKLRRFFDEPEEAGSGG